MSNTKEPIALGAGELSSFISFMLMQQGKTEVTMSFEEFEELKIGDHCIQSWANRGESEEHPESITLNLVAVADLPEELTFAQLLGLGDDE